MSSFHQRTGRLDRAIDHAVRDLVQADPRPGLSGRVVRKIKRGQAPAFVWRYAPLAAAAVVVLAIAGVMLREPQDSAPVARQAAQTGSPAAPLPTPAPQGTSPVAVTATAPAPPTPVRSTPRRRPEPSPESIFGPRGTRLSAASLETRSEGAGATNALDEPPRTPPPAGAIALRPLDGPSRITIRPIEVPRLPLSASGSR